MTDKELLEAAKVMSDNCKNREKCKGCPFEHTGETYLDNFCIVEGINIWDWKKYIEKNTSRRYKKMPDAQQAAYDAANRQIKQLEKQVEYYKHIAKIWQEVAGRLFALIELMRDDDG